MPGTHSAAPGPPWGPKALRTIFCSALLSVGAAACERDHTTAATPSEEQTTATSTQTRRPIPEGTHDGLHRSLLDEHATRTLPTPAQMDSWQLPYQAKLIVVNLLGVAARDRIEDLPHYMTEDARWGLPDRREIDARPILTEDDGVAFLTAFRNAATRFAGRIRDDESSGPQSTQKSATFACPPMLPAVELLVRNGAEPMWCYFNSHDKLDWLVFRMVVRDGRARVDYVGLFEERPTAHVVVERTDKPPPVVPPVRRRGVKPGERRQRVPPRGPGVGPEGARDPRTQAPTTEPEPPARPPE